MKIDLEFYGFKEMEGYISVNDKLIKLKDNKDGGSSCQVESANGNCNVVIYKSHKYTGSHWVWWNLLYFFISIFGIFDVRQNKKCLVLDASFNVTCNSDTKIIIRKQNFVDGGKYVSVETDCQIEEITNTQFYDVEGQKRHSKMKKIKIASIIVSVFLIVGLIILL